MDRFSPIGIFDSGLGGLTALSALQKEMPYEKLIYFGDTARVPYGGRDKETLARFAASDIALLRSFDVKAVLVACGTLSSVMLEEIKGNYPIPLVGVVKSASKAAVQKSKSGRIALWGTAASVASGAYVRCVEEWGGQVVAAVPCPKLVPLIEAGKTSPEEEQTAKAIAEYLAPVLQAKADTLILGCTHYPLLEEAIRAQAPALELINSGAESVEELMRTLEAQNLLSEKPCGQTRFLVSGDQERFIRLGSAILGQDLSGKVDHADAGE